MALSVVCFLWGAKYGPEYVARLAAGLKRNIRQPYTFEVVSPGLEDVDLTRIPGCFARLRAFSPEWQAKHGVTDRLVCLDLDLIVTGPLDALFDRPEPFTILQGVNASNPCPYNGSIWMLRAGYRSDVWADFSLDAAERVEHADFPDDQAWFAAKMPNAAAWTHKDGVFAYRKRGWTSGDVLPRGARIVAFPGWRDPSKFTHLPWVRQHWLAA